ncbi:MAG: hypothetical protein NC311_17275 [Muribaculaceae bacterium]|nr:hypothetical protein [Lachnospiraceae bacterium]MCM1297295.1 hypothetical protein [Muribaculaceae bacterium]
MVSKANSLPLEADCINYPNGITLKSRKLKLELKRQGITQGDAARSLGISKYELRYRLNKRQAFCKEEIVALVYLIGAKTALRVIWFPTIGEKERVKRLVWEDKMSYESKREEKLKKLAELRDEYGEDWDQSEDFEDYIFETDELPSRRFMRRRNDA